MGCAHIIQVLDALATGIGVGKLIAQVGRNVGVIGVAQQAFQVVLTPVANPKIAEVEQHRTVCTIGTCREPGGSDSYVTTAHPEGELNTKSRTGSRRRSEWLPTRIVLLERAPAAPTPT